MTVAFSIPGPLRPLAAGRGRVVIEAAPRTVREALDALWIAHPELRARVVDEQGRVRPHVNVFVGADSIRWSGGLDTPLPGPVEIAIIPAVSGGRT